MILRLIILLLLITSLNATINTDTLKAQNESYNFLSIGIGAATKDLNYLQITYDRRLYKNVSIYGFLGLPTILGYGISWQQNYNNNGWVLSSGYGYNPFISDFSCIDCDMFYLSIMHQWKLWNSRAYLSTGIQINAADELQSYIYNQNDDVMGSETGWKIRPYPIASVDWRLFSDKKKINNEKKKDDKKGVAKIEMIIVLLIISVILLASMP